MTGTKGARRCCEVRGDGRGWTVPCGSTAPCGRGRKTARGCDALVHERKCLPEHELRVCCPGAVRTRARTAGHKWATCPRHKTLQVCELRRLFSRGLLVPVQHRCWTKPPTGGLRATRWQGYCKRLDSVRVGGISAGEPPIKTGMD
jgi:hypothetical protein